MPEPPDSNPRKIPSSPYLHPAQIPFAELNCKTNFSFLQGASHPDEIVHQATKLGYRALAITDHNSLAGVVRAHKEAQKTGLKLLIGSEVTLQDSAAIVLLATNRQAYAQLSQLLTCGKLRASKGQCHLTVDDIARHAHGLIGCVSSLVSREELKIYHDIFGDRCYLFANCHLGPNDTIKLSQRQKLSKQVGVPLVASNDVYFHVAERRPLADVLTSIRSGCTIYEAGDLLLPNAERYLKSPADMYNLFNSHTDAIHRTVEIADRCHFNLDELRYEYPEELAPPGLSPLQYLEKLTWEGARSRFPDGVPESVCSLIRHELNLIGELHYEAYFLTVWDLVVFAKSKDILCQGRGSSANSVICYCLGITAISPERMGVLFERFISRERGEPPDIDIDFEHQRREEVLQYIYDRYGRDRAAMTAEVITYRPRSAIRDVGKSLGLSISRISEISKGIDRDNNDVAKCCQQIGMDLDSKTVKQFCFLVKQLLGFPRHLGQHVGGMVITRHPLCELVTVENATMQGRTVIEWDKDDLDVIGILKVDCLALGMLTAVHKCFDLIGKHHDISLTMSNVKEDDQDVYDMICKADAIGVFQIESRAQLSMLPRLKPRCFYDLVIEIAIVRPGPIQGEMVHPYLKRRQAREEFNDYPSDEVREVLKNTLGVPLFQEQAMKLAIVAAGFTPGEADALRRAMASWKAHGSIDKFQSKLITGMLNRGYTREYADQLFNQISGFGSYGFPESHAASFAIIAYASAWLKYHYPAEFCVALLNSQPMGFYAPAQLIWDARQHGVEVHPIDVNYSHWDSTIEHPISTKKSGIRLGLRMAKGLKKLDGSFVERHRHERNYRSVEDLRRRAKISNEAFAILARADAFGSLQLNRRDSLWQALKEQRETKSRPLFDDFDDCENSTNLPLMTTAEEVASDYRQLGLSLKNHPLALIRERLNEQRILTAKQLTQTNHGTIVKVAGIVLVRQRPATAKNVTFVTIEDETGPINLIIRFEIWRKYRQTAAATAYLVHGRLQNHQSVIHVLVDKLDELTLNLPDTKLRSRDFH